MCVCVCVSIKKRIERTKTEQEEEEEKHRKPAATSRAVANIEYAGTCFAILCVVW